MNAITEIERLASQRIAERTAPTHAVPRPRRLTRVASTLRRVADSLDS